VIAVARYRRAHPFGSREAKIAVGATLVLAVYVTFLSPYAFRDPAEAVPIALIGAVFLAFGWRAATLGVYVNTDGVRVRGFYGTRTVPWSRIARFESRPATRPRALHREALWIVPVDGAPWRTSVALPAGRWLIRAMVRGDAHDDVMLPRPRYEALIERLNHLRRYPQVASIE
jgi:Bacterial PH domain